MDKIVSEARKFAIGKIVEYSDEIVYHDYKFAKRYISLVEEMSMCAKLDEYEKKIALVAAWLITASFQNFMIYFKDKDFPTSNLSLEASKTLKEFATKSNIVAEDVKLLEEIFSSIDFLKTPTSTIGIVLDDGITAEIITGNARKNIKAMYEELILKDLNISKKKWLDIAYEMSKSLSFNLDYCKKEFAPSLDKLQTDLLKEKKQINKTTDVALQKELSISDIELKELKKKLKESKGRDGRGIQTMFRTTLKNHYTLNEMVDKKANIMITVNSIILSLIIGGIIRPDVSPVTFMQFNWDVIPVIIITIMAVFSVAFAILSIRPEITHGKFTEDDIRNKNGNLLYYGNFHSMQYRDYEWGFLQMMNDQDFLYSNMMKDLYFLGLSLKIKFKLIRLSLTIFLVGIIASVISFLIIHFFISPLS